MTIIQGYIVGAVIVGLVVWLDVILTKRPSPFESREPRNLWWVE